MKMKAFCLQVIHDYIRTGAVKIVYKGDQPVFDFDMFKTRYVKQYKEMLRVYVGNGITMMHFTPDVVSFKKDGNILTFNVKEILKEYKEISNEQ